MRDRLRFGCSLCDDTHTAAFDTAGGGEESWRERDREKGGDTGGKDDKSGKKNTRRGADFVFVPNYVCVCGCLVSIHFLVRTCALCYVLLQIYVNVMYPLCTVCMCSFAFVSSSGWM